MTPDGILGAAASAFSGIVGAAGAAIAVYLTLAGQRREDRQRIHAALVREIIEFARVAVGHLETCENIRAGVIKMPVPKLSQAMQMPSPIIYPAVADKIGLLKSPQHVVAFYMRIKEIDIITQTISDDPTNQTFILQDNNVRLVVQSLLDVCQFAKWIIEDADVKDEEFRAFDRAVTDSIIFDIKQETLKAQKNFRIDS